MKQFESCILSRHLVSLFCFCMAACSLYGAIRELQPFEITVYASSEYSRGYPARNVVNNKGMTGQFHDGLPACSWRSLAANKAHPGTAAGKAWIKFRFDRKRILEEIRIWNENHEPQHGLRDIVIQASVDNKDWKIVKKLTLPRGTGKVLNKASATINCRGVAARYVMITAASNYGRGPVYKLGEVRFSIKDSAHEAISPTADSIPEPKLTIEPKRSIAIDRNTGISEPPENPLFKPADIKRIKSMGFDSVKILFSPYAHMDGSDLVNTDYIRKCVNTVVENGLPCIVCVHPPGSFKEDYFGDKEEFRKLCAWYENLAAFLADNWSEEQIVFQMMTEPFGASTDPDAWNCYNTLQHRMWASIRKKLPQKYTLILGGDEAGNLEALYSIRPVKDPNVMYSFTHHIPHLFAFHGSRMSRGRNYDQVSGLSWPADPQTTEESVNAAVKDIPTEFRQRIRKEVQTYYAVGWGYDRQYWLMKSLRDWNTYWGGKLKIICVEFGCVDNIDESRYLFISDLRKAMEANNIGWVYWAYNRGSFTVYHPGRDKPVIKRMSGIPRLLDDPEKQPLDPKMLDALFQ